MYPYSSTAAPGAPAAPTTGAPPIAVTAAAARFPLALPPHLAHHYYSAYGVPSDRASSAPLPQPPNAAHALAPLFPARWYVSRFSVAQYAAQYAALHAPTLASASPSASASALASYPPAAAASAAVAAARDAGARVPASACEFRGGQSAVPASAYELRGGQTAVPASAYTLRGSCKAVPPVRVAEPSATAPRAAPPTSTAAFRSAQGHDTAPASAYQLRGNQTVPAARVSESRRNGAVPPANVDASRRSQCHDAISASAYELLGSVAAAAPSLLTTSSTLPPASPTSTYFHHCPTTPANPSLHHRTTSAVLPPHVPGSIAAPVTTVEAPAPLPPRRGRGRPRKYPEAPSVPPANLEVPAPPRRGPGRPRKYLPAPVPPVAPTSSRSAAPEPPRRGPGRPRKTPVAPTSARADSGFVVDATPPAPARNDAAVEAALITSAPIAGPHGVTTVPIAVPNPIGSATAGAPTGTTTALLPLVPEPDHEPDLVDAVEPPAPVPAPRVLALAALDALATASFMNLAPAYVGPLVPSPHVPAPAPITSATDAPSPPTTSTSRPGRYPRLPPDPHALPKKPTRPRTAYMYYCQAERARVTAALERDMYSVPQRPVFAAVTRALGEAYRELGFVERHPYEMQAEADKRRYMAEMDTWLEEARKRRGEEGVREAMEKPPPKTRKRRETGVSATGSARVPLMAPSAGLPTVHEVPRPPARVRPPLPPLRRVYDEIESETYESDERDDESDESESEAKSDEEEMPPPPLPVKRDRGRPRKNPPSTTMRAGPPITRRTRKKRRLLAYNVYFSTEIHRMIGLK
ncbi:hypothetical protein AMAG_19871 [Allomyces macrogynus ATCC 38327]|uniref:HMG box domain-containing protein n=1 Tax=Allomyces macrogynus (strain ATCC 38327) TaxID=578462 RepID=A0A0L0T2M3_ALLM3|nr:hypothetical protein AMAG_19871 [Allomyces macrogynus ATCC 38327]|eukprot:KNE68905.1 hypothetical protein AMAG_19871 [Allomyces macrogynus ATCC 38327]